MMTTIIPSVLLTVLFMGMVIMRERSVPVSISAMVYALPEGGWRWLWTLWLWAVDILTFAPMVELLDRHGLGVMAFAVLAALAFVGAWPLFDVEHRKWHYRLAIAGGILSQACVLVLCWQLLLVWLMVPVLYLASALCEDHTLQYVRLRMVLIAELICWMTSVESEVMVV